jgi:hypothetical protein
LSGQAGVVATATGADPAAGVEAAGTAVDAGDDVQPAVTSAMQRQMRRTQKDRCFIVLGKEKKE